MVWLLRTVSLCPRGCSCCPIPQPFLSTTLVWDGGSVITPAGSPLDFSLCQARRTFGVLSGQDANELKEAMTYQSLKSFFYELVLS